MSEAEVGDARAAAGVDHHVGRLEVAVNEAALVNRFEPVADVACDVQCFLVREVINGREILTLHILHDDGGARVDVDDVVDAADVRMRDLAPGADLAQRLVGGRNELQRDGVAEFQIIRAVDLAHPAAAERPDDAKSLGDDRPRHQLRVATGPELEQARRTLTIDTGPFVSAGHDRRDTAPMRNRISSSTSSGSTVSATMRRR